MLRVATDHSTPEHVCEERLGELSRLCSGSSRIKAMHLEIMRTLQCLDWPGDGSLSEDSSEYFRHARPATEPQCQDDAMMN